MKKKKKIKDEDYLGGISRMSLGTLGDSLLRKLSTQKDTILADKGQVRTDQVFIL